MSTDKQCSHADQIRVVAIQDNVQGCEDCLKIGGTWVHLTHVSDLRACRLLQLVAKSPCPQALENNRTPDHPVRGTR